MRGDFDGDLVDGGPQRVRRPLMAATAAAVGLAGLWAAGVVGAAPAAAQQEPLEEMVFVVNAF